MSITAEVKILGDGDKETIDLEQEDVALIIDEDFNYKLRVTLKPGELKKIPGHKLMMMTVYYLLMNNTDFHEYLHEHFENNRDNLLDFYNMEPVVKH